MAFPRQERYSYDDRRVLDISSWSVDLERAYRHEQPLTCSPGEDGGFERQLTTGVQGGTEVGLGPGLHISRMVVEHLHGQDGVQSTPGQGATFWFTMPLPQNPGEL